MSNQKAKLRSVTRTKKRPPRPELAHPEKKDGGRPVVRPTIRRVEVNHPQGTKQATQAESTRKVAPVTNVEPVLSVEAVVKGKLERLSLPELRRYARLTAKGADDAVVEHGTLEQEYADKLAEIKRTKTPAGADEDVRKEYNGRRAALRKERDMIGRRRTIAYENAVALERAADEYAYIISLLTGEPEADYRKQPRINEKCVELGVSETMALVDRMVASGKFNHKEASRIVTETKQPSGGNGGTAKRQTGTVTDIQPTPRERVSRWIEKQSHGGLNIFRRWLDDARGLGLSLLLLLCVIAGFVWLGVGVYRLGKPAEPMDTTPMTATVGRMEQSTPPSEPALPVSTPEPVEQPTVSVAGAIEPAPVPVADEPAEPAEPELSELEPMVENPIVGSMSYGGYELDVALYDTHATVRYPASVVGESDIAAFCAYEYSRYPSLLEGVAYRITSPGILEIEYPLELTEADKRYVLSSLWTELSGYLDGMFSVSTEEPTPTSPDESPVVVESVPVAMPEPETEVKPVSHTISLVGYIAPLHIRRDMRLGDGVVSVDAYDGHADISYPSYVTDDELSDAATALSLAYSDYLDGVSYTVTGSGRLAVEYPKGLSKAEIEGYLDVLEHDLAWYVSRLAGKREEPVAETSVAVPSAKSEPEPTVVVSPSEPESEPSIVPAPIEPEESKEPETNEPPAKEVTAVIVAPVERGASVASSPKEIRERTFPRPVHSLILSGSPYGLSYIDFYKAHDILASVPRSRFTSRYGFGLKLAYQWRFSEYFSAGIEAGYSRYSLDQGGASVAYTHIPLLVKVDFHYDWDRLGLFCGIGAGVDLPSMGAVSGGYFAAEVEAGLSYRLARHWSLSLAAQGGLTLQNDAQDPLQSSMTLTLLPVTLGVAYHF